jgi:hypothetical protein
VYPFFGILFRNTDQFPGRGFLEFGGPKLMRIFAKPFNLQF